MVSCSDFLENLNKYVPNLQNALPFKKYIESCICLTVKISFNQDEKQSGSGVVVRAVKNKCKIHQKRPCTCEPKYCISILTASQLFVECCKQNMSVAVLFKEDTDPIDVAEIYKYIDDETCTIKCYSNNDRLYNDLYQALNTQKQKYREISYVGDTIIIISFPHCQEKMISIGRGSEIKNENKTMSMLSLNRLKYNITTCDGSIGAPVLSFQSKNKNRMFSRIIIADFIVHSAAKNERESISEWAHIDDYALNESFAQVCEFLYYSRISDVRERDITLPPPTIHVSCPLDISPFHCSHEYYPTSLSITLTRKICIRTLTTPII